METKQCRKCGETKPIDQFHKCAKNPDGLQTWCHRCINEYKRERRDRNRSDDDRVKQQHILDNQKMIINGMKKCSVCKRVLPINEFYSGEGTGGTRSNCADCHEDMYPRSDRKHVHTKDQSRAMRFVKFAIKYGQMIRPEKCEICGDNPRIRKYTRIQFHHTNGYDDKHWYYGIFLCAKCHNKVTRREMEVIGYDHFDDKAAGPSKHYRNSRRVQSTAQRMATTSI